MGIDIYAALREHPEIKLSHRLTILELAKMAKPDGTVRTAYTYIANRIGGCKRTAIRHIHKLVDEWGVLEKRTAPQGRRRCLAWNTYRFAIAFTPRRAYPPDGDTRGARPTTKVSANLAGEEEGKPSSSSPAADPFFSSQSPEGKAHSTQEQAARNLEGVRSLLRALRRTMGLPGATP